MQPLFEDHLMPSCRQDLEPGAVILRGYATSNASVLLENVSRIAQASPFRHMVVSGGRSMSVGMTNCGRVSWISDPTGYRYGSIDPDTGAPWPAMPDSFMNLAVGAAAEAGFAQYDPDACLINRYAAGARLGLHQDRDEKDSWAPIVSVSLGLSALFFWGGKRRSDSVRRIQLESGDVVVWGGPARFVFHGVAPLKEGVHPLTGAFRINLTFRKVF